MTAPINVPTAGYAISKFPDSLTTLGIGSCIVICLYSQEHQTGALIHCMLPRTENDNSNPYRCVDTGLNQIVVELLHRGIKITSLTAKLVGGSQMFPTIESEQSIGELNIAEATHSLHAMGIPVVASDLGGNSGRSLVFDLNNGSVSISRSAIWPTNEVDTNKPKVL